ncbi:MAG TPA: hypothetical protein DG753_00105 [Clostridium sp.]|nr:hypothetical protein [Clostridium sp.]
MGITKNSFGKVIAKMCFIVFSVCTIFYYGFAVSAYAVDSNEDLQSINKTSGTDKYTLTLIERGNVSEHIKGSDIKLHYDSNVSKTPIFDEGLLKQKVDSLKCFNGSIDIESRNPKIEYVDGSYIIRKEIYGTRVNKDLLYKSIVDAIIKNVDEINLDKLNVYYDPSYTSSSDKVIQARDLLNRYVSANINYSYGGNTRQISGNTIKDWIYIDSDYNISIDSSKARTVIEEIADEYTYTLGKTTAVSGGYDGNNHGWEVDVDTETNSLVDSIKSGQSITKYPAYKQTKSADYLNKIKGDTFVEIDMEKQYLWFYKNGYIVAEGNVVTGNLSQSGCATPDGVYSLNNKQRDTNLVGPDYVSPVSFWMPFIRNSIGLHDASWRSEYGGNIYKTNGSHGCVNLPYSLAQSIYSNISIGTPVVCYY